VSSTRAGDDRPSDRVVEASGDLDRKRRSLSEADLEDESSSMAVVLAASGLCPPILPEPVGASIGVRGEWSKHESIEVDGHTARRSFGFKLTGATSESLEYSGSMMIESRRETVTMTCSFDVDPATRLIQRGWCQQPPHTPLGVRVEYGKATRSDR
jgi:hypothetical protein